VSPLEKNRQRASELLARLSQPRGLDLHVIPQHRLLGIRMQIHLLVHPLGHRVADQVMLEPVRSYVSGTMSGSSPWR
jgi:hypothetical protein